MDAAGSGLVLLRQFLHSKIQWLGEKIQFADAGEMQHLVRATWDRAEQSLEDKTPSPASSPEAEGPPACCSNKSSGIQWSPGHQDGSSLGQQGK